MTLDTRVPNPESTVKGFPPTPPQSRRLG
jgi:hypothetical protein